MTRFYDLRKGEVDQFERHLVDKGNLSAEEVRAVLRNPDLAQTMVEALREQMAPPLFVSPEVQLANVRQWNDARDWGFTEADFPSVPDGLSLAGALEVLVLAVYLPSKGTGRNHVPSHVRTAQALWDIARHRQPNSWQWDSLHLDADHLRLLEGIEPSHEPGIRWVMVDLGAHWNGQDGIRPCDVRSKDSAHAEVLAAAAHFPDWVQAMNGTDVPYVWLPGYQVTLPGEVAWTEVPVLYWNSVISLVYLSAGWADSRYWSYAIPVRREL